MEFEKIDGRIREDEFVSVAAIQLQVAARDADTTAGNDQPKMPKQEMKHVGPS